jgi:integrase
MVPSLHSNSESAISARGITGSIQHRYVWGMPESKSSVPVIVRLRKILDNHRRSSNGTGSWIFSGAKKRFSLHLDNLSRREIAPVLAERWKGWHAFRRGISTNLFELGVPTGTIQLILRHADTETTRRHYIVLESERAGCAAMRKLEKAIAVRGKRGPS